MSPNISPLTNIKDISSSSQKGFTLIELVMTIVILASSTLILIPFFSAISHSADPIVRHRAVTLGQAMLDEIMSKRWDDKTPVGGGPIITGETPGGGLCSAPPRDRIACYTESHPSFDGASKISTPPLLLGPESGENRATYNDIDDYNGLNVTDGNFRNQNNDIFVLHNYQRRVDIAYISSSTNTIDHSSGAAVGTTDSKRVVVTVTSPQNEIFYFTTVVCNI